LKFNL